MKKIAIITVLVLLSFTVGTHGVNAPNSKAPFLAKLKFAASMNKSFAYASTEEQAAEWAKGMWRILAGEPGMAKDDYIMGWLEKLLDDVSDGVNQMGYATCSSVPSSGTQSHPSEPVDITFQVSNKTVPVGTSFFNSGQAYDKSVTAEHGGVEFIHIEFDCDANKPNMYVRMDQSVMSSSPEQRVIEIYAQADLSVNKIAIDFSMTCTGGDCANQTNMYLSMNTPDGIVFDIIGTLTVDDGTVEAKRMSVHGNKNLEIADIHFMDLNSFSNSDDINPVLNPGTVSGACVDFNDPLYIAAAGACSLNSLNAGNELDNIKTDFFGLSDLHIDTVSSQTVSY